MYSQNVTLDVDSIKTYPLYRSYYCYLIPYGNTLTMVHKVCCESLSNLDPDEDVAHGDEDHWQYVAKEEVPNEEVEVSREVLWPLLETEAEVRALVHLDQVEEDGPGDRGGEGYEPYDKNHGTSTAGCDLALEWPPDCQEPATEQNSSPQFLLETILTLLVVTCFNY